MTISFPHLRLRRFPSALDSYVILVVLAGLAVFVSLLPGAVAALRDVDLTFWVLAACVLPAETLRVTIPRHGRGSTLTMSRPFALTLLTGWSAAPAVMVFVTASVVSDLIDRKPPIRILFNAAQYALAIAAGGVVYTALSGRPSLGLAQVPAFIAAAVVLVLVNRVLVSLAVALHEQRSITIGYLRAQAQVELVENIVQSTVVLIALLVAGHRLALPMVLALPALPIYVAGRAAARAEALSRDYAEQLLRYRHLFVVADRYRRQADAGGGVNSVQLGALALDLRSSTSMLRSLLGTISKEAERHGLDLLKALAGNGVEHTEELSGKLERLQQTEAPTHSATHELLDAAEVVRVAEQLARTICQGRPVVTEAPTQGLPVCINQDEILDVLGNLILNAHRFALPQTPIHLIAGREDDRMVLAVEDDGVDVSPEQRERMFNEGANGLSHGVAMARQLAHANGGELRTVDPDKANGRARFELRLPLAEQPSSGLHAAAEPRGLSA
jgi:signal transduction histidine kinase